MSYPLGHMEVDDGQKSIYSNSCLVYLLDSPSMKPSSPAVVLSSGLIDQVVSQPITEPDLHTLAYHWEGETSDWPYTDDGDVR